MNKEDSNKPVAPLQAVNTSNLKPLQNPNEDVRSKSGEAGSKIKKVEVYKAIAMMMLGGKSRIFPPFKHKFHVLRDKKGAKSYVEELSGQVIHDICKERIIDAIINYSDAMGSTEFVLKPSEAREAFNRWSAMYPDFDQSKVVPVRQKGTPGYCWHRLPFDIEPGPTPLFDELMGRSSNRDALMAWIGSLFIENSNRQQYVWLYGSGDNGKGALARFLGKCLENTTAEEDAPMTSRRDKPSQFWTDGIIGKRLVVFDDCEAYFFPTSGFFKKLTGGNAIRREIKNGAVIYADLICKFMFTSNNRPEITDTKADKRRAIYCTFAPIPDDKLIRNYESKLWDEAPYFLNRCVEAYYEHTDEYGRIETDKHSLDDLIEASKVDFESFVETWLVCDPTTPGEECPMAKDMTKAMRLSGFGGPEARRSLRNYLERQYDVRYTAVRDSYGKLVKRYVNCRMIAPQEPVINHG